MKVILLLLVLVFTTSAAARRLGEKDGANAINKNSTKEAIAKTIEDSLYWDRLLQEMREESLSMSPTGSPVAVDPEIGEFVDRFVAETFIEGLLDSNDTYVTETENGAQYKVEYDVTIVDGGIVSLATIEDTIGSVSCSYENEDMASVTLSFLDSPALSTSALEKMFPIGSLLVIDRESFGPCYLGILGDLEDPKDGDTSGYLNVTSVSSTDEGVVLVSGVPAAFYSMFQTGSLNMTREDDGNETLERSRNLATLQQDVLKEVADQTVKLDARALTDFPQLRMFFSIFTGPLISFVASLEYIVEAEASFFVKEEIDLCSLLGGSGCKLSLASIPLAGLPTVILKPIVGKLLVPPLELGARIDVNLVARGTLKIKPTYGFEAKWRATTGRKMLEYRFSVGGLRTLSIVNEPPKIGEPTFTVNRNEPAEADQNIELTTFVGIEPQLVADVAGFLSGKIGGEVGLTTVGKAQFGPPFDPKSDGDGCQFCHNVEADVSFTSTNIDLKARAGFRFFGGSFLFEYENTLGETADSFPVTNFCLLDDLESACGDICCADPVSCTLDDAGMGNCGPTPAPTFEPTVSPTEKPTMSPTETPTSSPTAEPTLAPTAEPTSTPEPTIPSEPTVEGPTPSAGEQPAISPLPIVGDPTPAPDASPPTPLPMPPTAEPPFPTPQTNVPTSEPLSISPTQQMSNLGLDFWVAEPFRVNQNNGNCPGDFAISVANPNQVEAMVTIVHADSGTNTTLAVAAGGLETARLGCRGGSVATVVTAPVYHVISNVEVTVFAFAPLQNVFSNDATLILPTQALGVEHHLASHRGVLPQYFVIATEDDTLVEAFRQNGDKVLTGTLQRGQMYQAIGPRVGSLNIRYTDITGWNVVASKPVALFSGTNCATIGPSGSTCDILYEQILPVSALASSYVLCPTLSRPLTCAGPDGCVPDVFRFVGVEDGTTIFYQSASQTLTVTLNKRGITYENFTDPAILSANKPFYAFQYLISHQAGDPPAGTGDPTLMNMIPVEQYLTKYTILTPSTFANDFVHIVAEVGSTVTIDGIPVSEPCLSAGTLDDTQYCCITTPVSDGFHQVEGNRPFGLHVTGLDDNASYGYVGGARLNFINA